jgi:hypothetical protein
MTHIRRLWRAFLANPTAVAWFYAAALWCNAATIYVAFMPR